ncbi:Tfx family DNA-binding protein [Geoglobus sp.]
MKVVDSLLTERQLEIYIRRLRGEKLEEIARELGTTKSNISALEKKARRKIELAYNTIRLVEQLVDAHIITINPGTDLYEIPGLVYRKGDEMGIKIRYSGPELIKLLVERCGHKLRNREVIRQITVGIKSDGDLSVL